MPFIEFVVLAGFIDVGKNLIIQHYGTLLVVRGRKKLNHLIPNVFILFFVVIIPQFV
jgi:hypothetical protein